MLLVSLSKEITIALLFIDLCMRKDWIDSYIINAEKKLSNIETEYERALNEKNIPIDLQIDIKNMMENLRSVLDYLAHDIYDVVLMPKRRSGGDKEIKKIYFPYWSTDAGFQQSILRSLPDLNVINPQIYQVIEKIQPHKSWDDWLWQFCSILNEKKHDSLKPQKREEITVLDINFPTGANIRLWNGASIKGNWVIQSGSGKVFINNETISPSSPARYTTGNVDQKVTRWVSFMFADTNEEVMPLLQKSLISIKNVVDEVYQIL